MDRRSFLSGAAAASLAFAATASAEEHHHHAHGAVAANPNDALIKATAECIAAGRACLAHCIRLLSEGDKSMADCAIRCWRCATRPTASPRNSPRCCPPLPNSAPMPASNAPMPARHMPSTTPSARPALKHARNAPSNAAKSLLKRCAIKKPAVWRVFFYA